MSSLLRFAFLMSFLLLLYACGFKPMYGDEALKSGNTPLQGNIRLDTIGSGHEGQMLKTALEDRFNPKSASTDNAMYHLSVALSKQVIPSVVKPDGTIQRYDVRFESSFRLFRTGSPAPVFTGEMRRIGSYNAATNANFATYEAERDVIERCMQELAEDYVMRISGYLAGKS